MPEIYEGGCHCGAVRFRARLADLRALDCDCSICTKKGFLHAIVAREDFELLRGEDALTAYAFGTGVAKHTFCRFCGIHPFYTPRSHPESVDVNLRALDAAASGDLLKRAEIEPFDGRNGEDNVARIR